MPARFVAMRHPELGLAAFVPESAVARHEARGWELAPPPARRRRKPKPAPEAEASAPNQEQ